MREMLNEVLELQSNWSEKNTPEMIRRGEIVRRELPTALRAFDSDIRSAMGVHGVSLEFEGRDGTGRKTEIPWVRFCSSIHSPNAREGWYCVFLFEAEGHAAYLTICHGATRWENGEFVARAPEELEALVSWARSRLTSQLVKIPKLQRNISLNARRSDLGPAYERGTVAAFEYRRGEIPDSSAILEDVLTVTRLLRVLYDAVDLGQAPDSDPPEVKAVLHASRLRGNSGGRQGFGLTAAERGAVEARAMALAIDFFRGQGFEVKDVSLQMPYDLELSKDGNITIAEVKGTTTAGAAIILTRNEVRVHRERAPQNVLFLVTNIDLRRDGETPSAIGGDIDIRWAWAVEDERLSPLSYEYRLD